MRKNGTRISPTHSQNGKSDFLDNHRTRAMAPSFRLA